MGSWERGKNFFSREKSFFPLSQTLTLFSKKAEYVLLQFVAKRVIRYLYKFIDNVQNFVKLLCYKLKYPLLLYKNIPQKG